MKFEATCACGQPITTATGGHSWRHKIRPADKHQAQAVGVMRQR